jgi:hypothetical protein
MNLPSAGLGTMYLEIDPLTLTPIPWRPPDPVQLSQQPDLTGGARLVVRPEDCPCRPFRPPANKAASVRPPARAG